MEGPKDGRRTRPERRNQPAELKLRWAIKVGRPTAARGKANPQTKPQATGEYLPHTGRNKAQTLPAQANMHVYLRYLLAPSPFCVGRPSSLAADGVNDRLRKILRGLLTPTQKVYRTLRLMLKILLPSVCLSICLSVCLSVYPNVSNYCVGLLLCLTTFFVCCYGRLFIC